MEQDSATTVVLVVTGAQGSIPNNFKSPSDSIGITPSITFIQNNTTDVCASWFCQHPAKSAIRLRSRGLDGEHHIVTFPG